MVPIKPNKYKAQRLFHADEKDIFEKLGLKRPWLALGISIFSASVTIFGIQNLNINLFNTYASTGSSGGSSEISAAPILPESSIPADIEQLISALDEALADEDWNKGNGLTHAIFALAAGREKGTYLKTADIESISCPIFNRVDRLWQTHSKGKFGFFIQNQIATREKLFNDWHGFGLALGWGPIAEYTGPDVSLEDYPDGAYPGWAGMKSIGDTDFHMFPKINKCQSQG